MFCWFRCFLIVSLATFCHLFVCSSQSVPCALSVFSYDFCMFYLDLVFAHHPSSYLLLPPLAIFFFLFVYLLLILLVVLTILPSILWMPNMFFYTSIHCHSSYSLLIAVPSLFFIRPSDDTQTPHSPPNRRTPDLTASEL